MDKLIQEIKETVVAHKIGKITENEMDNHIRRLINSEKALWQKEMLDSLPEEKIKTADDEWGFGFEDGYLEAIRDIKQKWNI